MRLGISNQPTPAASPPLGPSRSFSPAPRRPTHQVPNPLARPGYNPRSSSLSVISRANASTSSLPGNARANGSTFKQQITAPASANNPLTVLEAIVGSSVSGLKLREDDPQEDEKPEKPEELIGAIDFAGLSLQGFAQHDLTPEDFSSGGSLRHMTQSVEECEYVMYFRHLSTPLNKLDLDEAEKNRFEDLHRSILVRKSRMQQLYIDSIRHVTLCLVLSRRLSPVFKMISASFQQKLRLSSFDLVRSTPAWKIGQLWRNC